MTEQTCIDRTKQHSNNKHKKDEVDQLAWVGYYLDDHVENEDAD